MLSILGNRSVYYSVIVYLLIIFILFQVKPKFLYTEENEMKKWGIGEDKILFPVYIIAMIISIFTLFFLSI